MSDSERSLHETAQRAVPCDHHWGSKCYRGMSLRMCIEMGNEATDALIEAAENVG